MINKLLIASILISFSVLSANAVNEFLVKADKLSLKNTTDAIFYYKKSIEHYPKDIEAYIGLAKIRMEQKKYVEALSKLLMAKDIDENNYSVNYNLGEFHYKRKNFYKAIKYYSKAQKLKKGTNEKLWEKMGVTYEKLGDITKAKSAYISALRLNNKNISSLNSLTRLDKLEGKQEHRY